ncbi:MAG: HEAT repeat domain-containing protein [Pirellulales bacterium]|nr:HEAT repeat domain-containing protein [Pirellulales bacterium]
MSHTLSSPACMDARSCSIASAAALATRAWVRLSPCLLCLAIVGCQTLNLSERPDALATTSEAPDADASAPSSTAATNAARSKGESKGEKLAPEEVEREAALADVERQLGSDIWFQTSRRAGEIDWLRDHLNDQAPVLQAGSAAAPNHRTSKPTASAPSEYRWRHVGVEEILARPAKKRPNLRVALNSTRRVVAANAAIALARQDDTTCLPTLIASVESSELNLPCRRAAAEALGYLDTAAAQPALHELLDEYGRFGEGVRSYLPELHAELLRALAQQNAPGAEQRYAAALKSQAAEVRIVALAALSQNPGVTLPPQAHELRYDPDRRVRQVALLALAKSGSPEAVATIASGLRDHELPVQLASIRALGQLGGEGSRVPLEEQLGAQRPEVIRIAAAEALVTMQSESSLYLAVQDQSWRVRAAVARGIGGFRGAGPGKLAARLLTDQSPMVQAAAVEAIAAWPFEEAAPLWLLAVQRPGYATKKGALAHLAERWSEATNFPIDAPFDAQREALGALERRAATEQIVAAAVDEETDLKSLTTQEVDAPQVAQVASPVQPVAGANAGASLNTATLAPQTSETAYSIQLARVDQLLSIVDQAGANANDRAAALAALSAMEDDLLAPLTVLALERGRPIPEALYRHVLPERDAVFEVLLQLDAAEIVERRRAASSLVARVRERPLSRLALVRLVEKVMVERDADVWRSALVVTASEPDEAAVRLAYAALTHEAPDVRRRGCEYLAQHADPRHVTVLLPSLTDADPTVVRAGVRALGEPGMLADPRPVETLLATPDRFVQLEAARTLARAGHESGRAALERLVYDLDLDVRMQAVRMMGEVPHAEYTAALMNSLDGPPGLKRAAAASLANVVGQNIGRGNDVTPPTLDEQAIRWRRWFERANESAAVQPAVARRPSANAPLSVAAPASDQSQSRATSYQPRSDGR